MSVRTWLFIGLNFAAGSLAAQQPTALEQRVQDSVSAARSQVPTVTLGEAIDLAVKTYPTVVSAQAALDIAHANQKQVLASWLPNLNVNTSVSKSPSTRYNPSTGVVTQVTTPYSGSVGMSAGITLFDGGTRLFQGRQASAQTTSADASLVNQKFQVTLLTKQAFFSALAAVELERVALTAVQRAEEQLKIAREKLSAGSAIRSDTLSATVSVGQARLSVLNAQTQRANQEATLARLIGFDKPVRALSDSSVIAIVDIDTTGLRAEALRKSPSIATADAALRVSEATVSVAKAAYLPTLSASYSNSRSGAANGFGGAIDYGSLNPTWNMALTVNWPLFDRWRRETTLSTANANRESAVATAADSRRSVNAQVTQQLAALQSARTSLSIAAASREAADESLRVQRERYRLGAATIVEVLQAQQSLDQAEVDAVTARVNYQLARANLEALLGRAL